MLSERPASIMLYLLMHCIRSDQSPNLPASCSRPFQLKRVYISQHVCRQSQQIISTVISLPSRSLRPLRKQSAADCLVVWLVFCTVNPSSTSISWAKSRRRCTNRRLQVADDKNQSGMPLSLFFLLIFLGLLDAFGSHSHLLGSCLSVQFRWNRDEVRAYSY